MTEPVSRRNFLAKASVGVAAATAAALAASSGALSVGGLVGAAQARPGSVGPAPDLTPLGQDVVAHVRNASTGEVLVMAGTSEIVFHDRALVSRLLSGARRAGQEA
ncbi:MAG TPA: hypothetical protein VNF73_08730 [Candidatus Saccharimonadales bacterium]|nr:hypothetical protein [Candidatus Saccharimonadales bacterium]